MTSPNLTVLCHYRYDPLDQLISHALSDIPERQRFYCKSRLATEIQGALRYSIVQHGDQLLAQQRSEGDVPDTTLLATDQQRSVLQTVKANHPPQPIAYSPYGHRPVESGLLSLVGFNGERPDPVTGCYLLGNGYRAFNAVLMRFNSPDSWSPFGKGGLNPYAYCLGNPISQSDPSGHAPIFSWSKLLNLFTKRSRSPQNEASSMSTNGITTHDIGITEISRPTISNGQSSERINPRLQRSDSLLSNASMDIFKPAPNTSVIKKIELPQVHSTRSLKNLPQHYASIIKKIELPQVHSTTSPKNLPQQHGMTAPELGSHPLYPIKPGEKYPSRQLLEKDLEQLHKIMRPLEPFKISDYADAIRREGF